MQEKKQTSDYREELNLPYSLEAEQAVLGCILMEPSAINVAMDLLTADQFYLPEHQAIYRVMTDKMMASQTIDLVTVLEALKGEGFFSGEEGKAYLFKLAQIVPSINNLRNYAAIVREKYQVRQLIKASREIVEEAMDPGADPAELIDAAEQRIFNIRENKQTEGLIPIKDVLASNFDMYSKLAGSERSLYVGIPTGFSGLDNITTGLNRSDLIIVGARPGMGKTCFILNIARNVALLQNRTVAVFNLEMSREQMVNRFLSTEARISGKKLRTGLLSSDEWTRLAQKADVLCKAPIYLDDTASITVPEIKARLRRLNGVSCAVIDYLQLMRSSKNIENRTQEVSEITRALKIMAKELNIPIIVAAQLARSTEKQSNHRPALADLRESGSIEQDADQVLFLFRDEYYINEKKNPDEVEIGTAEVIVSKNRHGELGTVKLAFSGEFGVFSTLENYRNE